MPSENKDEIANTQMFRAFVAKGEQDTTASVRRLGRVIGIIIAIVAAVALVYLLQH